MFLCEYISGELSDWAFLLMLPMTDHILCCSGSINDFFFFLRSLYVRNLHQAIFINAEFKMQTKLVSVETIFFFGGVMLILRLDLFR